MKIATQLAAGQVCSTSLCMPPVASVNHSARRPAMKHICRAEGKGLSYKDAGVDIDAGNELVKRIQKLNPSIGGFSGMVPFGKLP
jgi:hypothetical protein